MPQLVELEEVRLHAVIFKMSGDNVAVRVVCRMLDGAEIRHVHVLRHDDEAAWVLTRGALDADKPQREAVLLGLGRLYPALLKIFLDIAVGGLFGEGAYRSGAENMVGAEKLRSISGVFSLPGKPRNVSNGISKPSRFMRVPHSGQSFSGMSAPQP